MFKIIGSGVVVVVVVATEAYISCLPLHGILPAVATWVHSPKSVLDKPHPDIICFVTARLLFQVD